MFLEPVNPHKLHIPLCPICLKPLFHADEKVLIQESYFDVLEQVHKGPAHAVCVEMTRYVVGMNHHIAVKDGAEA